MVSAQHLSRPVEPTTLSTIQIDGEILSPSTTLATVTRTSTSLPIATVVTARCTFSGGPLEVQGGKTSICTYTHYRYPRTAAISTSSTTKTTETASPPTTLAVVTRTSASLSIASILTTRCSYYSAELPGVQAGKTPVCTYTHYAHPPTTTTSTSSATKTTETVSPSPKAQEDDVPVDQTVSTDSSTPGTVCGPRLNCPYLLCPVWVSKFWTGAAKDTACQS